MLEGEGVSTTMDSKDSLKHSVANGEGNSNLTTQSSTFNIILKTRVIEPPFIEYHKRGFTTKCRPHLVVSG